MEQKKRTKHVKLNEFFATAICGNDILSSALYVSGIAIIFSGVYAPLVLLLVAGVLFLYKAVYIEVVEALPINGGAYNCLLNGTTKTVAAIAGVMTILSYVATAVISAKIGVEYINTIIGGIPVIPATIAILFGFALLVISGIKDSARVALIIFIFHIASLVLFVVTGFLFIFSGSSHFAENIMHTTTLIRNQGGLFNTLYLAFSASLLGVSGFESSANFVEEQQPGVFRKTLRNMLIGVAIFNPIIAYIVLQALPFESIANAKDFLLADTALVIGQTFLQKLIAIDAFLVLSGAVLTSFIGVSGLASRMASDNCLPNFLSWQNKKGSHSRIIIAFFLLCSSILLITGGNLLSLAGVYTIAFLGVMSLFAFGNLVLRQARSELKRTYHAPLIYVLVALVATLLGIVGNIRIDPQNLRFFDLYFIPTMLVVLIIIYQDDFLRIALRVSKPFPLIHNYLTKNFQDLTNGTFVVFIHNIGRIHGILDYIHRNETGWNIILVHCSTGDKKTSGFEEIKNTLPIMQKAGVFPHFNIQLVHKQAEFGPEIIDTVSKEFKVRKNRILIGSIHHFHEFDYGDLGGVRIIF